MTDVGLCKDTFLDIFRKGKRYEKMVWPVSWHTIASWRDRLWKQSTHLARAVYGPITIGGKSLIKRDTALMEH